MLIKTKGRITAFHTDSNINYLLPLNFVISFLFRFPFFFVSLCLRGDHLHCSVRFFTQSSYLMVEDRYPQRGRSSVLSFHSLRQVPRCGFAHMQPQLRSPPKNVFRCAGPLMAHEVINFSLVKAAAEICAQSSRAVRA